jgi:hypothetical protein
MQDSTNNARDSYRMQLASSQHFLQVIRSSPFNSASEGIPLNLLPDDFDVSSDGQTSPSENSSIMDTTLQLSTIG